MAGKNIVVVREITGIFFMRLEWLPTQFLLKIYLNLGKKKPSGDSGEASAAAPKPGTSSSSGDGPPPRAPPQQPQGSILQAILPLLS